MLQRILQFAQHPLMVALMVGCIASAMLMHLNAYLPKMSTGFLILLVTMLVIWQFMRGLTRQSAELRERNEWTQKKIEQATQALAAEKERAEITLASIADAVITTDNDLRIVYLNPVAERLSGWTLNEIRGRSVLECFKVVSELNREPMRGSAQICLESKQCVKRQDTTLLVNRDGAAVPVDESAAPLLNVQGEVTGVVLVFHDVSESRRMSRQMNYQATHDALTGLPNRLLLLDQLEHAIRCRRRTGHLVVVMVLDLDRFKLINDSLGHEIGDQMLCQVATRLQAQLCEASTVARIGGDEFVVLLPNVNHQTTLNHTIQQILDSLNRPFNVAGHELFSTASIGVSIYSTGAANAADMVKHADTAMYRAKQLGKNNYVIYSSEIGDQNCREFSVESGLRQVIRRDELELYYQPQVDVLSGHIIGAEALLRWNHPSDGIVLPAGFLAVAEESGLIVEIGEWVMIEACKQNKAWQELGYTQLKVAVNIADRQFQRTSLVWDTAKALSLSGLQAQYLELELTERVLATDTERAVQTLHDLKELGVKLSIDDFGTGYSSLAYLKRFPIDTVKVDRAFIKDLVTDDSDAAICSTIIDMAHHLQLSVVAEGVEKPQQLSILRKKGCDISQGFYHSPPLPAEAFVRLLGRDTAALADVHFVQSAAALGELGQQKNWGAAK